MGLPVSVYELSLLVFNIIRSAFDLVRRTTPNSMAQLWHYDMKVGIRTAVQT